MFKVMVGLLSLAWVIATLLAYRWRKRHASDLYRDLLAIGGYALLTVAFFWQLVFIPETRIPIGGGDLVSFLYPVYSFAARSLQSGHIPFWNPYLYGGSPFVADMQSGVFYPLNLLAFILERPFTYESMEWLVVLHYFMAASFMYVYGRGLGMGRLSAFVAGLIFAFAGFTVAHLGHLNMLAATIWLPLILFFFHRAVTRGSVPSAVGAGAIYAISILAGHLQISLYFAFFLALYWLWVIGAKVREKASLIPSVLTLPVTALVAFGATALQLIPSYELVGLSLRSELTYAKATEYAASPRGLITLFVPHFFGGDLASYWGIEGNLTEVYGYAGILSLLLAVLALLLGRQRWRWFFASAAALFLLLSLGQHSILHGWLYRFVPGFDKVRSAGRFLLLFDFCIAALAGFGLNSLAQPLKMRERPRYRFFLWGVAAMAFGGIFLVAPLFYHALLTSQDKDPAIFNQIAIMIDSLNLTLLFVVASLALFSLHRMWPRLRAFLPSFAIAIIVLDLFSANVGLNPTTEDITIGHQHPEVLDFLKRDTSSFRIDSVTNVWDVWQPNITLLYGVDDVMGIWNPMLLADYDRYWANLGSRSVPAYDLLNAKYTIGHKDVPLDREKFSPVFTEAPKVNVYENLRVLPRAMVVPEGVELGRDEILSRLRSPSFDPRSTILLEQGAQPLREKTTSSGFAYQILGLRYPDPNQVLIEVNTNQQGYLLLSDVLYPGWHVYIDGQEVGLLRANYIFRGVPLPAGSHVVRFSFRPRHWEVAMGISAFTWLVIAGTAVLTLKRR